MNQIKFNRINKILYPLFIYFIVYQVGGNFLFLEFGEKWGRPLCLIISGLVCLVPLGLMYKASPKLIPDKITSAKQVVYLALQVVAVVAIGIILNVILTQSGLVNQSKGYAKAKETLLDGSIFIQILCSVIVVPILEEILLRGIICTQVYFWHGPWMAIITSSIFFGILHNNIVQFIYALVIGLGLGFIFIKSKRLSICILAHSIINLVVILLT